MGNKVRFSVASGNIFPLATPEWSLHERATEIGFTPYALLTTESDAEMQPNQRLPSATEATRKREYRNVRRMPSRPFTVVTVWTKSEE